MCSFLFTPRSGFAVGIVLLALAASAHAGGELVAPAKSFFDGQNTSITLAATTQEWIILHRPYLKIVGPTGLRFAGTDEPILRQPPRMAAVRTGPVSSAAISEAAPVAAVKITTAPEAALPVSSANSVLNGDQQSTTLPPVAVATPTPAPTPANRPPDTLSQQNQGTEDLSSALLYLEAPTASGTKAALIAPIDLQAPTGAPQPPSSTTYEVK